MLHHSQVWQCACADVSVELAVCCLLLGDSEKAEDILGLGPDSPPENADPAVRSFVMVRIWLCARLFALVAMLLLPYPTLGYNPPWGMAPQLA